MVEKKKITAEYAPRYLMADDTAAKLKQISARLLPLPTSIPPLPLRAAKRQATSPPTRAASRRGHKKENKNPQYFYSLPLSSPNNKPQKFPLHIFAYCVIL
jgi:hypothetical protein